MFSIQFAVIYRKKKPDSNLFKQKEKQQYHQLQLKFSKTFINKNHNKLKYFLLITEGTLFFDIVHNVKQ